MTHPHWCDRLDSGHGAHRSRPVAADRNRLIWANLYEAAGVAGVELRCGTAVLSAREAYGLGRLLMLLGRVAEDAAGERNL